MPQVSESAVVNPTLADLYLNIIPPPRIAGNVATGVVGRPGTADWGPVNVPMLIGSPQDGAAKRGGKTLAGAADKHDLATHCELSFAQASGQTGLSIWEVRVTDGTDTKASCILLDTTSGTPLEGAVATAKHSGSLGNFQIKIEQGSLTSTFTATVLPFSGALPETYKNIPATGFWTKLIGAINNGWQGQAPSEVLDMAAGDDIATALAPALGTFSLTGGTSGRAVNTAALIGQETTAPSTGMYALRDLSPIVSLMSIPGLTDTTAWAAMAAFAKSAGMYAVVSFPVATSTSSAISTRKSLGLESKYVIALKDFVKIFDYTSNEFRLITPDSALTGLMAVIGPHESPMNREISGIVGTERTGQAKYSNAELSQLEQAGINLIMNPCPGGRFFGLRHGRNTASSLPECAIEHTRMVNFCIQLLGENLGEFVGRKLTSLATDATRKGVRDKSNSIFGSLQDGGVIEGFTVQCDMNNNTRDDVYRHILRAYYKVTFASSVWYFIASFEGGVNVVSITQGPTLSQALAQAA